MANEREPWMLTVGQLREALTAAHPDQVVVPSLSTDHLAAVRAVPDGMGVVLAVKVDRADP
jgi:hypothetical protein